MPSFSLTKLIEWLKSLIPKPLPTITVEELEAKIIALGFPLNGDEFKRPPIPDEKNAFMFVQRELIDQNLPSKELRDNFITQQFDKAHIPPDQVEAILPLAHELANFTKFDPKRDYDRCCLSDFKEPFYIRCCTKILSEDAVKRAASDDGEGVYRACQSIARIVKLRSSELTLLDFLVTISGQATFYRTLAKSVVTSKDSVAMFERLKPLWEFQFDQQKICECIRFEFYYAQSYYRNFEILGGSKALLQATNPNFELKPSGELKSAGWPTSLEALHYLSLTAELYSEMIMIVSLPPSDRSRLVKALVAEHQRSVESLPPYSVLKTWQHILLMEDHAIDHRILSLWAIENWVAGKGSFSLESPRESVYGGKLRIAKRSTGFCFYSDGPDQVDSGGPGSPLKGDDFGIMFADPVHGISNYPK